MRLDKIRFAVSDSRPSEIEPYLYRGWSVVYLPSLGEDHPESDDPVSLIYGHDWAGFTLDAIIDRLATGLHTAYEIKEPQS